MKIKKPIMIRKKDQTNEKSKESCGDETSKHETEGRMWRIQQVTCWDGFLRKSSSVNEKESRKQTKTIKLTITKRKIDS